MPPADINRGEARCRCAVRCALLTGPDRKTLERRRDDAFAAAASSRELHAQVGCAAVCWPVCFPVLCILACMHGSLSPSHLEEKARAYDQYGRDQQKKIDALDRGLELQEET